MVIKRILLICSRERGKEVDMFPITNKGYLPVDIVIHPIFSSHCETVCLLSKLHEAKHHVNVTLDMDEMDLTAAERR